jgi:hypothetical protein
MSRKPIIAKVTVTTAVGICVYGLIRGVAGHSLAQVFFNLSAILGGIGLYRNPSYLGATVDPSLGSFNGPMIA